MQTIPIEQHSAIFTVINLSRGTLGWGLKTATDLDEEIIIWALTFTDYQIPNEYLPFLWKRARDLRISRLQNGMNCPDFTAELLVACWIGENGLKKELENERTNQKRFLPENAESICKYCFGTNFRTFTDDKGYRFAIKCNHKD